MEIKFWGVRGSIPAPGPDTLEFGGNTTCVEVVLASGRRVMFDGGSGLRLLGDRLVQAGAPVQFHLLLTHGHWDHLLGIPFFAPIYREGTEIIFDGWPPGYQAMTHIFNNHWGNGYFPVAFSELKARIDFLDCLARTPLDLEGAKVEAIRLNHPQGGLGFRLTEGGRSLVFITDNELGAGLGYRFEEFVRFAQGCDLLIHDAQYLPEEMPTHQGWGHSTYEEAVNLALKAGTARLLLTHHDPARTDIEVREIEVRARELAASRSPGLKVDAIREGDCFSL